MKNKQLMSLATISHSISINEEENFSRDIKTNDLVQRYVITCVI